MSEFIYVSKTHGVTADWNVIKISTGEVVVNNLARLSRLGIMAGSFASMEWWPVEPISLENE